MDSIRRLRQEAESLGSEAFRVQDGPFLGYDQNPVVVLADYRRVVLHVER